MSKHRQGKRHGLQIFICVVVVLALLAAGAYMINDKMTAQRYSPEKVQYVKPYADTYGLDPLLVAAMVQVESDYQHTAQSNVGAVGLMQIMPDTGKWIAQKLDIENFSEEMLRQPDTNLRMGTWYMDFLLDRYNNDRTLALCAYNAGQGNVDQWLKNEAYSKDGKSLDVIPVRDAEYYVEKVEKAYSLYEKYGASS